MGGYMKNYRFGFSLKGFLAFMLVTIPNFIWMLVPPVNNELSENNGVFPFDMIQSISQVLMIALLIILVRKENKVQSRARLYIGLGAFMLVGYYAAWIWYYTWAVHPWLLVSMAVMPALYFIAVCLWLRNYIAVITSVVFGAVHIAITCSNYL